MKNLLRILLLSAFSMGAPIHAGPFSWYPLWDAKGASFAQILNLDQVGSEVWLTFPYSLTIDFDKDLPSCSVDVQFPTFFVTTVLDHFLRVSAIEDGLIDQELYDSHRPDDTVPYSYEMGTGWINLAKPPHGYYKDEPGGAMMRDLWYIRNYPWIYNPKLGWWYITEAGIAWNANAWWIYNTNDGWFWTTRNFLRAGYVWFPGSGWELLGSR